MRRRRSGLAALISACLAATVLGTATAQAESALNGESLYATQRQFQGTCQETQNSTINYTASGVAAGPYPGTFSETGTLVAGPQNNTGGQYSNQTGDLVSWQVSFTIDSGTTHITGTKHDVMPGLATCNDDVVVSGFDALRQGLIFAQGPLGYTAQIQTPQGTTSDTGRAESTTFRFGPSTDGLQPPVESIYEDFYTFQDPTPVPDRPGKGCGDKNHVHERTSDCKSN